MSGSAIVPPMSVIAPQDRLLRGSLAIVCNFGLWALAQGNWDAKNVLLVRWNGQPDTPKGNPISTGHPTWFVLPEELWEGALTEAAKRSSSTVAAARAWLPLP